MKPERYRTTLCGKRATRRIKWFQPKGFRFVKGVPYVDVFAIFVLVDFGRLELFAVSAQYGIDKRNRHVLPCNSSVVLPPEREDENPASYTIVYALSAPVGRLQECGEELREALEGCLSTMPERWVPPSGLPRQFDSATANSLEDRRTRAHICINSLGNLS